MSYLLTMKVIRVAKRTLFKKESAYAHYKIQEHRLSTREAFFKRALITLLVGLLVVMMTVFAMNMTMRNFFFRCSTNR
jgi:hypothetical protein